MTTATATKTQIGTCGWAGHTFTRPLTKYKISVCPTCAPYDNGDGWIQHSHVKWNTIKAKTTATECGDQCTSAKNPNCACECGGLNHGSDHGA